MTPKPAFTFGLVTDVQYADINDGHSYAGIPRYYRSSLQALKSAVFDWQTRGVDFVLQLGDIIDGHARSHSEQALEAVLTVLGHAAMCAYQVGMVHCRPTHHIIGNHCLYNFPRSELLTRLGICSHIDTADVGKGVSYYSFIPAAGWRFIMLDSYDVSVLGWPETHAHHKLAAAILAENNSNENKNMFDNLEPEQRRFVAFGGGIGLAQLGWLRNQLDEARQLQEQVIVAAHVPIHPATCSPAALLWNSEEVLQVLHAAGSVVMTLCGHTHQDGYYCDEHGVHHSAAAQILGRKQWHCYALIDTHIVVSLHSIRVFASALEAPKGSLCHASIAVYDAHIEVEGVGAMQSQALPIPNIN